MSKNIVIQEGGVGKSMSVNKLRTDEVGGGSCLWVPEDETQVMHKNITEEGVYKARELDSVYGYDEVTVDLSRKIKTKRVVENGVYYAEDDEILGYSEVDVNVPSDVHNTRKRITENGTYVADDEGFTGYGEVTVDVPAGRKRDKRITENGIYDPEEESLYGYGKITVDVKKPQLRTKTIRDNGTYEAQKDDGVYGYSLVNVNVPLPKLKSRRITENGTYIANQEDREYEDAPSDVYGYSQVVVDVPQQGQVKTKTIRENGTYTAANEELLGYSVVNVNVPGGKLGTKSITENGTYTAADDNLYGFRSVSVRVAGSQGSADSGGRPTTSGGVTPGGIGSSVIGRDTTGIISGGGGDGNEYAIGVDDGGSIVATPIPSGMKITSPPTKTTYISNQEIDFSGIKVILQNKSGGTFTNETYPNGEIPLSQLEFPVTHAPSGGAGSVTIDGYDVHSDGFTDTLIAAYGPGNYNNGKLNLVVSENYFFTASYNGTEIWGSTGSPDPKYQPREIKWYVDSQGNVYSYIKFPEGSGAPSQTVTSVLDTEALGMDFKTNAASIPVRWESPYSGKTFEESFTITVVDSDTSGSGTESGGTNTGGTGTGTGSNTGGSGSNTGGFGGNDDDFSGSGGGS